MNEMRVIVVLNFIIGAMIGGIAGYLAAGNIDSTIIVFAIGGGIISTIITRDKSGHSKTDRERDVTKHSRKYGVFLLVYLCIGAYVAANVLDIQIWPLNPPESAVPLFRTL